MMSSARCRLLVVMGIVGLSLPAGCHNVAQSTMQAGGRPATVSTSTLAQPEAEMKLSPKQLADMQISMGRALEDQGQTADAMAAYKRALEHDPSRGDAYSRLAIIHDRKARFDESETLHRKAVQAQPGNANLYCNFGYSLYLQERFAEAEKELTKALTLNADHQRAHNNLALVLARTGRQQEALNHFFRGGCNPADAHANLAFALALQKDWDAAREHYQKSLASNPSNTLAQKGLREIEMLAGRSTAIVQAPPMQAPTAIPVASTQAKPAAPAAEVKPIVQVAAPQPTVIPAARPAVQPATTRVQRPVAMPPSDTNVYEPASTNWRLTTEDESRPPMPLIRGGLPADWSEQTVPSVDIPAAPSADDFSRAHNIATPEVKPLPPIVVPRIEATQVAQPEPIRAPSPAEYARAYQAAPRVYRPVTPPQTNSLFVPGSRQATTPVANQGTAGGLFNPGNGETRRIVSANANSLFNPANTGQNTLGTGFTTSASPGNLFNPNDTPGQFPQHINNQSLFSNGHATLPNYVPTGGHSLFNPGNR